MNKILEIWLGVSRDDILGADFRIHFPHLKEKKYANRLEAIFSGGPPIVFSSQLHKHLIPAVLPGGKLRVQQTTVTALPSSEEGEYFALLAVQDVTSLTNALENNKKTLLELQNEIEIRKKTEEQLKILAQFDPLTGLANRILCHDFLNRILAAAARHHRSFALFFLDLDFFKEINDTMGHDAGDLLLKKVAERLTTRVRANDMVSRFGGDEFVIILDNCKYDDVVRIAQDILDAVCAPYIIKGEEVFVGITIGIAMYPDAGENCEDLCKSADVAMYNAKSAGRNRYKFFSPQMNAHITERLQMEKDLRHALARDEFVVFFQPKVDRSGTAVAGVEALLRWRHGKTGIMYPVDFIHIAKKTGLIISIDDWVLKEACRQTAGWLTSLSSRMSVTVGVNISIKQLQQRNYWESIREILAETGLPAANLEIELTERTVMEDHGLALKVLQEISDLGVRISIDDFGLGYSSLSLLQRLPVDSVKMDMSFVRNIGTGPDVDPVVKAIISMSHSMGLHVVAKGVETQAQMKFLVENGCDFMQGYYFSHPLPPLEITEYLKARQK